MSKYKTITITVESYKNLKKISEDERRSLSQQVSKLVDDTFESKYGKKTGIASNLVLQQTGTTQTTQ